MYILYVHTNIHIEDVSIYVFPRLVTSQYTCVVYARSDSEEKKPIICIISIVLNFIWFYTIRMNNRSVVETVERKIMVISVIVIAQS